MLEKYLKSQCMKHIGRKYNMIRIRKSNKYFNRHKKNQIHVINNTSLELPDKDLVAFLGPSGCGKTTLFKCNWWIR